MKPVFSFSLFLICFAFHPLSAQWWKTYPYHEAGTALTFPADEGYHPGEPVEWWYTTGHVTGDVTGTEYSYMLTYFYYPALGFDGFRIFNLANDDTGEFHDESRPASYPTLAQTHLEINANVFGRPQEKWTTLKDDDNNLIPFEYNIIASQAHGSANLTYRAVKRPLILGETGFFYQGATGYTYYYSQTMLEVTGTITFDGVTETVQGTAWIDRQWGQFNPNDGEAYEWFNVQLSNGMDINIWNIFDADDQIPDTSTYRLANIYVDETTDIDAHDFEFTRLQFNWMPDGQMCYSRQWRFQYQDIDLLITTLFTNGEVRLPFRFYEGATTVTGTVNGQPVTGKGFAECLHSYNNPQLFLTSPTENSTWDGAQPFTWQLLNPDGGRPVYYDVDISFDNKETFTKIAHNISDTFLAWDPGMNEIPQAWLKVTGYSIDSSLVGVYTMDDGFSYTPTGIASARPADLPLAVYPNPGSGNFTLALPESFSGRIEVKIYDSAGVEVLSRIIENHIPDRPLDFRLDSRAAGVYSVVVNSGERKAHEKVLIVR
jgi:predicted secreted hydrolase